MDLHPLRVSWSNVFTLVWRGLRLCCWSGQEADDCCSSDRWFDLRAAACTRMTLSYFFMVNSRCTWLEHCYHYKNTCEGGQEGNRRVCFFLGFFSFLLVLVFFFYFKFCQSSPVFGELRPLVHFDGELLMVSFCCKDVSFLRGGAQAEIVMWVGHIIGLQGKHAVRCWCRHIVGRALEKRQSPSLTSGIHVRRDDLPDGWHWDKWHSHCFFLFYFFYIY